ANGHAAENTMKTALFVHACNSPCQLRSAFTASACSVAWPLQRGSALLKTDSPSTVPQHPHERTAQKFPPYVRVVDDSVRATSIGSMRMPATSLSIHASIALPCIKRS